MEQEENKALIEISKAQQALERANDIQEIVDLRDKAMAFQLFANAQGFKETAQEAKIYQLKAERKAGNWLAEHIDHKGGRPSKEQLQDVIVPDILPDGVSPIESHRWQAEASVPEEKFNEWVDDCLTTGKEISANRLLQIAKGVPHVFYNTGENEWYTPKEYIEAAHRTMGAIDLDPASTEIANKTVRAATYYSKEIDGLTHNWRGRIWMNPPYASELIGKFTSKLCKHLGTGEVTEAIVLVNNATETAWFQEMLEYSHAVCFPRGRVKFIDINGQPGGAPLQGQAVLYMGEKIHLFAKEFDGFGRILFR